MLIYIQKLYVICILFAENELLCFVFIVDVLLLCKKLLITFTKVITLSWVTVTFDSVDEIIWCG